MNKQDYDGLTFNQLAERNAEHVTAIGRLEAHVKQLAAENETLLALMQEQSGCFNAAISEGFHDAVMQSGIEHLIDIYKRRLQPAIQCIPPTPATDSILASLRAEGVEMAAQSDQFSNWVQQGLRHFALCIRDGSAQLRSKSEVQS